MPPDRCRSRCWPPWWQSRANDALILPLQTSVGKDTLCLKRVLLYLPGIDSSYFCRVCVCASVRSERTGGLFTWEQKVDPFEHALLLSSLRSLSLSLVRVSGLIFRSLAAAGSGSVRIGRLQNLLIDSLDLRRHCCRHVTNPVPLASTFKETRWR